VIQVRLTAENERISYQVSPKCGPEACGNLSVVGAEMPWMLSDGSIGGKVSDVRA
jgi:hypothetical protein